jgi:hypothetical protein
MSLRIALLATAATLAAAPAFAQQAQPAPATTPAPAQTPAAAQTTTPTKIPSSVDEMTDEDYQVEALIVTATRQPGAVIGDIPPELQLTPRDIRAYGVSTVADLVTALAPQTSTGRGGDAGGRPVILVNGVRVSSFTEVRDLPTEAILRVDILPEEVALKYGYRADQRVMNLVLRPRFRSRSAEASYKASTQEGGGDVADLRTTFLTIQQQNRFLLDAKIANQSPLLESERDLAQPRPDAAYRTLVSDEQTIALNAVLSRPLAEGISGTLNGTFDGLNSASKLGVNTLTNGPLNRESETRAGHLGATAAGGFKGWSWTATGNIDRTDSNSTTERLVAGSGFVDTSDSTSTSADTKLVVTGRLAQIKAGAINSTFTIGGETLKFESDSTRSGVRRTSDLQRDTGNLQINIDVPITSVRNDVLAAIGDLSFNVNGSVDQLSDFGQLTSIGYGANWGPMTGVRFLASFTNEQNAPTVQQLGGPEQLTPGVQAYDFRTGQTVVISRLDGANPNLSADDRNVFKLGMNLKPFSKVDFNISANYLKSRVEDVIASFPTGSNQIEDAFPTRFIRDSGGRLLQIDARPVNYDRRDTEELRYGFTFRKPFGPQPPAGAGGGRFPGGAGGFQGRGQGQGAGGAGQGQRQPSAGGPAASGATTATQGGAAAGAAARGQAPAQTAQADGGPPPGAFGGAGGPPPGGGFGGPPPGGGGGFGGPGGGPGGPGGGPPGGFGGGPPGAGNFQFGVYHTIKFQDQIVIRSGVPVLDLLDGASIGQGGGTPRNQVDVQSNVTRNGLGLSVNARWTEGTTVRGTGAAGSQDLTYSDLGTINVRLFAELRQQPVFRNYPFFRAARATFSIDNLFDERQEVRDAAGATPISYQEDYLNPLGRTWRLSFRKAF